MYRVDGSSDLNEETLDHFEGWRGSRPVRIGNGAADQLQLDIYGEAWTRCPPPTRTACRWRTRAGWRSPSSSTGCASTGTSRTRASGRPAAAGRTSPTAGSSAGSRSTAAIRLAAAPRPARRHRPVDRPSGTAIYNQVMERGLEPEGRAFIQHYGTDVLDSSLLMMPLVGFISPARPDVAVDARAMDRELVSDSLVYRYNPCASPGRPARQRGHVLAVHLPVRRRAGPGGPARRGPAGLREDATYANHLGLFSEEIGRTGEQLGNFPQAFTHLALINAAINLDYLLDHGPANVEPVLARRRGSECRPGESGAAGPAPRVLSHPSCRLSPHPQRVREVPAPP